MMTEEEKADMLGWFDPSLQSSGAPITMQGINCSNEHHEVAAGAEDGTGAGFGTCSLRIRAKDEQLTNSCSYCFEKNRKKFKDAVPAQQQNTPMHYFAIVSDQSSVTFAL